MIIRKSVSLGGPNAVSEGPCVRVGHVRKLVGWRVGQHVTIFICRPFTANAVPPPHQTQHRRLAGLRVRDSGILLAFPTVKNGGLRYVGPAGPFNPPRQKPWALFYCPTGGDWGFAGPSVGVRHVGKSKDQESKETCLGRPATTDRGLESLGHTPSRKSVAG